MEDLSNTIRIGKRETTVNLDGHNPDEVNDLRVYADNKTANPDFLDRSSVQRFNVVENKFGKAERNIPLDVISGYVEWERL